MTETRVPRQLDINQISELLPHRFPLLMIDRVLDFEEGEWAIGIKNVTINEPFFVGHFPAHPVMPGVMVIEAMAQLAGALVAKSMGINQHGKLVYFMSIEKAKFRAPVVPGDQVRIEVHRVQRRATVWKFSGVATVEDKKVAEAEFAAMIIDA